MSISSLYKFIALSSPHIEVLLRQLYWNNVNRFSKFNPHKASHRDHSHYHNKVDFEKVLDYLRDNGVKEGSILIVHSSYETLSCTGLQPSEIVEKLLSLVGKSGTLAMPAIRKFKDEPEEDINDDNLLKEYEYNTRKTKLTSGVLPYYMLLRDDSEISRYPLNPLVAIGYYAKEMMANNLNGETPSPHGKNSAWKFCVDKNAIVVGLGVSLEHYNTTIHVAEEAYDGWKWKSEEWFCKKRFHITDGDFQKSIVVKDRKSYWGKLHFAEMTLWRDLLNNNVVKTTLFNNVLPVSIEKSQELISFLRSKNSKGYPYF